jgi:hypothetical protein
MSISQFKIESKGNNYLFSKFYIYFFMLMITDFRPLFLNK